MKLEGVAMYELKIEVVSRLNKISKADVKRILLDGISKRFTLPSNRFLTAVVGRGKVEVDDVSLLSPYLIYLRKKLVSVNPFFVCVNFAYV